jgi:hypothetical protein
MSTSFERKLTRAMKRADNRKKRMEANKGKATKPGFFGNGAKVKWLYI